MLAKKFTTSRLGRVVQIASISVSGKLSSISSLTGKYSSHSLRLWKRLYAVSCISVLLPISNIQSDPACCAHFFNGVLQNLTKTEQPLILARKTRHHPSTKLFDPSKKSSMTSVTRFTYSSQTRSKHP